MNARVCDLDKPVTLQVVLDALDELDAALADDSALESFRWDANARAYAPATPAEVRAQAQDRVHEFRAQVMAEVAL